MSNPRVTVKQGDLEGLEDVTIGGKKYYSFRGIPFAEPPVGKLRFKPPVPHASWSGVRDATKEGSPCMQIDLLTRALAGSEDCLFLNVYTPQLPPKNQNGGSLPVMVYIHGGGFVCGSCIRDEFGPDFIIEEDTILVTINYRLGPLGFLCLDIPDAPGNAGLRDQSLALKWVHENIQFFNGDQNNVTIFGISAGSASVEYQILSPMSKGLFHKAILQSGSTLNPWASLKEPLVLAEKVAKKLGIDNKDPNELLKFLIETDVGTLVKICASAGDKESVEAGELFPFTPVVEKTFEGLEAFLDKKPIDLIKSGNFSQVPTITGMCENEGELFKFFYEPVVGKIDEKILLSLLPPSFKVDRDNYGEAFKDVYKLDSNRPEDHVNSFLSDVLFVGGIYTSFKNRMRYTDDKDNYLYMFSHLGNINFVRMAFNITTDTKALHGDDTCYVSLNAKISPDLATPEDKIVRSRMVKMWTDFSKTGNPTPELSSLVNQKWLPTTDKEMHMMEIGKDLEMKSMPWKERMDLWEDLYNNQ